MNNSELRGWLTETAEEDLWWLCINGEVYDVSYDLAEVIRISLDFRDQDVRIQHVSKKNIFGESGWVKYEPKKQGSCKEELMVHDELQANSTIVKSTEIKKPPLKKARVFAALATVAILLGLLLKQEHNLENSNNQVKLLEEKINAQADKISSLNSEVGVLERDMVAQRKAGDDKIKERDNILKEQNAQLQELKVSYQDLAGAYRKLGSLNDKLIADCESRSAIIVSLQNQINQDTRQSEALVVLEREKLRLIKQQNELNLRVARSMEQDRKDRNLLKAIELNNQVLNDSPLRKTNNFLNPSEFRYIQARRKTTPEPLPFNNTQREIDKINKRLDRADIERRQREHIEAGEKNEEAMRRYNEQSARNRESIPSVIHPR